MLEQKSVEITLRTGEVLRGQKHFGYDGEVDLVVKCLDQQPVHMQCPHADEDDCVMR